MLARLMQFQLAQQSTAAATAGNTNFGTPVSAAAARAGDGTAEGMAEVEMTEEEMLERSIRESMQDDANDP